MFIIACRGMSYNRKSHGGTSEEDGEKDGEEDGEDHGIE